MATTLTPTYGASAALTSTALQSLASDTALIAGWSSAVIANGTNLSVTEKISGNIRVGTTPTVNTNVFIYVWEAINDTPTYPDTITGSQAAIALTSANVRDAGAFRLGQVITVDATSNRDYPFTFDVAALFGGHMPKNFGVWIVQNTAAALNSAGNVITRNDVTKYLNT